MEQSLGDRQKAYEAAFDYKIMRRVPIIIRIDGRSFHTLTKKLQRPYCPKMLSLMGSTLLEVAKQIDGAVFAYQQSDEMTFVVRNDQTLQTDAWFGNRVQKVASISASIATHEFNKKFQSMESKPNLVGSIIFDARVFAVPDIGEAVNNLIWRQQDCIQNAITSVAYVELKKKLGWEKAKDFLYGRNIEERERFLREKCDIVVSEDYPKPFTHGLGAYIVPKVVDTKHGSVTRFNWMLDENLPRFSDKKDFIYSIIESGQDIFRAGRDLSYGEARQPKLLAPKK